MRSLQTSAQHTGCLLPSGRHQTAPHPAATNTDNTLVLTACAAPTSAPTTTGCAYHLASTSTAYSQPPPPPPLADSIISYDGMHHFRAFHDKHTPGHHPSAADMNPSLCLPRPRHAQGRCDPSLAAGLADPHSTYDFPVPHCSTNGTQRPSRVSCRSHASSSAPHTGPQRRLSRCCTRADVSSLAACTAVKRTASMHLRQYSRLGHGGTQGR